MFYFSKIQCIKTLILFSVVHQQSPQNLPVLYSLYLFTFCPASNQPNPPSRHKGEWGKTRGALCSTPASLPGLQPAFPPALSSTTSHPWSAAPTGNSWNSAYPGLETWLHLNDYKLIPSLLTPFLYK